MGGVIVHEWLAPTGGSENVFEVISGIFPTAKRYCLWNESEGRFTDVSETLLARTPLKGRKALALPFMPTAWRHLPRENADWILVSSHAFAHHTRFAGVARDAPKMVYAHTPARYVWEPELDGRGGGITARAVSSLLKPLDRKRAEEPVSIAANSHFVAERIARAWERESTVIYPPVDVEYFARAADPVSAGDEQILSSLPNDFIFGASRLVPYKRLDTVIAAGSASDVPVVIAGEGPDIERLRSLAQTSKVPVRFIGKTSRALLAELYRRAMLVVFVPVEDFGIIPVEAMASGTPVIANAMGGASESVVDGVTGAIVADWAPETLRAAVERAVAASAEACKARASLFDTSTFATSLCEWSAPFRRDVL